VTTAQRTARGIAGVAIVLGPLELLARIGALPATSVPAPSIVLVTAVGLLVDPIFLANVGGTLVAWSVGLIGATAIAVPLGLLLGASHRSARAAAAAIDFLRPIPSVALIPLAILLLGRGLDMKAVLVAYAATWPILFNTIAGVHDLDPVAGETARSYGLSRATVVRAVLLPSAAPFIYTGIRISAGVALVVAVSAEMLAGGGLGIGTWMLERSGAGVPRELLCAGIVVIGMLGLAINGGIATGDRRLFAWHPRHRGSR
jgi:NitT/TauT family transport system permease protein